MDNQNRVTTQSPLCRMGKIQHNLRFSKFHQQQQQGGIEEEEIEAYTCEICVEPGPNKFFNNNNKCSHPFCTDCIIKYIQVKLEQNVSIIHCPALNCHHSLDHLHCRPLIPPQLFDKWCDLLFDSAVLSFDDRVYCPNMTCSELIVNECGGKVRRAVCPRCKNLFCFSCAVAWHGGFGCRESREARDVNDIALGVLVETKKWRRCPTCRHFVERDGGCRIINCRCGTTFCYKCGRMVGGLWCYCGRTGFITFCNPAVFCNMISMFFFFVSINLAIRYCFLVMPTTHEECTYFIPNKWK